MSDTPSIPSSTKQSRPWAWLILSALVFGALMAFRSELHSIWLRALVAGIAFALLYPAAQGFLRKRLNQHPTSVLEARAGLRLCFILSTLGPLCLSTIVSGLCLHQIPICAEDSTGRRRLVQQRGRRSAPCNSPPQFPRQSDRRAR